MLSFTGIGYVFPALDIALGVKRVRDSGGEEGKFDLSVTVMAAAMPRLIAKPIGSGFNLIMEAHHSMAETIEKVEGFNREWVAKHQQ